MRLKLFEAFAPAYKEVGDQEYDAKFYGGNNNIREFILKKWEAFTKREIVKICKIFQAANIFHYYAIEEIYTGDNNGLLKIVTSDLRSIKIIKIKDAWYGFHTYDILPSGEYKWQYYICDQWDGLLECIKQQVLKIKTETTKISEAARADYFYYKEISTEEYDDKFFGEVDAAGNYDEIGFVKDYWEAFTEREISKLCKIFQAANIFQSYEVAYPNPNSNLILSRVLNGALRIKLLTKEPTVKLVKLKDGWYGLKNFDTSDSKFKIYECDQWDGLLKCIKDLLIQHRF